MLLSAKDNLFISDRGEAISNARPNEYSTHFNSLAGYVFEHFSQELTHVKHSHGLVMFVEVHVNAKTVIETVGQIKLYALGSKTQTSVVHLMTIFMYSWPS